jgi:ABC-type Fe3+-hydroxamate transport system substrate-binding protein
LTELVFDLGRGGELVGITDWCVHPADRVGAVEKIGGTKTPNVARIVELAPDLVLMNEEENRVEDARAFQEAGLRCHVSFPRDAASTASMVRDLGAQLGERDKAERIARDIEERSERARVEARDAPPVRFAYVIWRQPWMSVNRDTFASALFEQAGGRNVFGERSTRYPEFTPAELAAARPEAVFLCSEPYPFQSKHADELGHATGLMRERFHLIDGEYLSWHGSRTPDGVDYAARCIAAARGSRPT